VHVGGDERGTLRRQVTEAAHHLRVLHVVGGRRFSDFVGLVVEYVNGRGTRREVDVVAREVVGLVAENVVEPEGPGRGRERLIHDVGGQKRPIAIGVYPGAVVAEERQDVFVVHLDAQLSEDVAGFGHYPLGKRFR